MTTVKVVAGQSILDGRVRKPSAGLEELIWNAFDEDAKLVTVTRKYNVAGPSQVLDHFWGSCQYVDAALALGRAPRIRRSAFVIWTSLMLASRRSIRPS